MGRQNSRVSGQRSERMRLVCGTAAETPSTKVLAQEALPTSWDWSCPGFLDTLELGLHATASSFSECHLLSNSDGLRYPSAECSR